MEGDLPDWRGLVASARELSDLAKGLLELGQAERSSRLANEVVPLIEPLVQRCSSFGRLRRPAYELHAVITDEIRTDPDVTRLIKRLDALVEALELAARISAYRRPRKWTVIAMVLGVLALVSLVLGILSAVVSVVFRLGTLTSVAFYGFIGLGLWLATVAAWRAQDPRPHRFSRRTLALLGAAAIVLGFVVPASMRSDAPRPIFAFEAGVPIEVADVATILPPAGPGWERRRPTAGTEGVEFAKDLIVAPDRVRPEDAETLRAGLTVRLAAGNSLPATEFLEQIALSFSEDTEGGRVKPISFNTKTVEIQGFPCLRHTRVVEDRGVPQFSGSVFEIRVHGLLCWHPGRGAVVAANWSHRYLQGPTPRVAEDVSDTFLAGLRFVGTLGARPTAVPHRTGRVIFMDDFIDTGSGWYGSDGQLAVAGYVRPRGYEIRIRQADSFVVASTRAISAQRDIRVQADVSVEGSGGYGPACRMQPSSQSYYRFVITTDGAYGIVRVVGKDATSLATSLEGRRRSLAGPGNRRIEADCVGSGDVVTLVLRVDGVELLRVDDRPAGPLESAGPAGFFAQGASGFAVQLSRFAIVEIQP